MCLYQKLFFTRWNFREEGQSHATAKPLRRLARPRPQAQAQAQAQAQGYHGPAV